MAKKLVVEYGADTDEVKRKLKDIDDSHSGFASALGGVGRAGVAAFAAVGAAAVGVVGMGVKIASDNQQAKISFETMLGSAEKAGAFLKDLKDFAAATPFEFPELRTAASSLVAAGVETSKIIPIMTNLGNVTSGMGTGAEGVKRATIALQQMSAAGKITGEDLNQLRDAGVPVFDLLSAATGKSKEAIAALAQSGKLGKAEMDQLFAALESGAGLERFTGLMDAQSKTLAGLFSTLKDVVGEALGALAQPIVGGLAAAMPMLTEAILGFVTAVGPSFTTLIGSFIEILSSLLPVITPVATMFAEVFAAAVSALLPVISALLPVITQVAGIIGGALLTVINALAPVLVPLANVFGQIVLALAPILPAIATLIAAALTPLGAIIQALSPVITTLADMFAKYLQSAVDQIMPFIPQLAEFIGNLMEAAMQLLPPIMELAMSVGRALMPVIMALLPAIIAIINPIITNKSLMQSLISIVESLAGVILALSPILTLVAKILGTVLGAAIKVIVPVVGALANVFEGIANAIEGVIRWIGKFIAKLDGIKLPGFLKPGSPSPFEISLWGTARAMKSLVKNTPKALGFGVKVGTEAIDALNAIRLAPATLPAMRDAMNTQAAAAMAARAGDFNVDTRGGSRPTPIQVHVHADMIVDGRKLGSTVGENLVHDIRLKTGMRN